LLKSNLFFPLLSYSSLIGERWDKQRHRSLRVACLYFNPILLYAPGFTVDNEVPESMYDLWIEWW